MKMSIRTQEEKDKIAQFRQILQKINKDDIGKAFQLGIETGFFGKRKPTDDLYLQFNDAEWVYTLIRMPIQLKKTNNPISESIINKTEPKLTPKNLYGRKVA